jgi:hypothetical protein
MQILQVTTYSLDNPRHGGQIRCSEIRRKLEAMGNKVESLCIIQGHEKSNKNPYVKVTEQVWQVGPKLRSVLSDVDLHFTMQTDNWQAEIKKRIDVNQYDLVVIEQPWMHKPMSMAFSAAQRWPIFLYSSHNVEAPLKTSILENLGEFTTEEISKAAKTAQDIENDAALSSQLVLAVSPRDAKYFESLGVKNVVVAGNGANLPIPQKLDMKSNAEKYFLFVGSGHPPNFEGFNKFLGDSLAFIPPDFKIYCVGSVCHLIQEWINGGGATGTFTSRARLIGEVSENQLVQIIHSAIAILLPINTGGGSNLKTAEALLSGKSVIATPLAMRGFESWIGQPGVFVEETPEGFRRQIYQQTKRGEGWKPITRKSSEKYPLSWRDALTSLESIREIQAK